MKVNRTVLINILIVLLSLIVAALWIYLVGGRAFLAGLGQMKVFFLIPLLLITTTFILLRFVRWHFLLRRFGIRLPTRPSFSIYLASLAGTATPAYLGEMLIRGLFVRRGFGIPFRFIVWVLIIERLLDVVALGFIGVVTASTWENRGLMSLIIIITALLAIIMGLIASKIGIPSKAIRDIRKGSNILIAVLLSLFAWIPASLLITVAGLSLDHWITPQTGMNIFSGATLLGGMTLAPAGVGTTGSLMIIELAGYVNNLATSIIIVTLVRITSTVVTITTGTIYLIFEWRRIRRTLKTKPVKHFDEIALEYHDQFKDHVWNHLLARKSGMMSASLLHFQTKRSNAAIGLDLGCGLGFQCVEMARRGFSVIGVDLAFNLIRHAHKNGAKVINGDALQLPFSDDSLDYIYTIGVLHHLPGSDIQKAVFQEITRVLKPEGLLIVHETNPNNPLFRFYMSYLFPILKSIDEGTEWWIDPKRWNNLPQLNVLETKYFTFIPDFVPEFLLRPLLYIEARLERSKFCTYSVHYMAVIQKEAIPNKDARYDAKNVTLG